MTIQTLSCPMEGDTQKACHYPTLDSTGRSPQPCTGTKWDGNLGIQRVFTRKPLWVKAEHWGKLSPHPMIVPSGWHTGVSQSGHMGNTVRQARSESDPQGPHPLRHRSQACMTVMCTDFQAPRPPLPSPLGIRHESAGPICNVGAIKG